MLADLNGLVGLVPPLSFAIESTPISWILEKVACAIEVEQATLSYFSVSTRLDRPPRGAGLVVEDLVFGGGSFWPVGTRLFRPVGVDGLSGFFRVSRVSADGLLASG